MVEFEEFAKMLDEITQDIPKAFFNELNGGIILKEENKVHEESRDDDLYTLGEYCVCSQMGRQIIIYYGSFSKIYGNNKKKELKEKLKKTILHEFTHHLESLAGERDLEIEDEMFMAQYRKRLE